MEDEEQESEESLFFFFFLSFLNFLSYACRRHRHRHHRDHHVDLLPESESWASEAQGPGEWTFDTPMVLASWGVAE